MAIGPLVGSIVGIHYMWAMFLASGLMSFGACLPALRIHEPGDEAAHRAARTRADGTMVPLRRVRIGRPMSGALMCGAALGLTSGVYDICWTLLLLARGASGLEIGISWTLFAVPFVLVAKPSGWLADHMDRRALVLAGHRGLHRLLRLVPLHPQRARPGAAGGVRGPGLRRGHACGAVPAHPGLGTRRRSGRIQGMFATSQTAFTAVAAAFAGAAFALASWLPFVTVASIVFVGLGVVAVIWRTVPGRVSPHTGAVPSASEPVAPAPVGAPVPGSFPIGVSGDGP